MDDITESGDRVSAAFEEHWPAVRGHALRLVRDSAAAEDLAQEAFVRLWAAHREDRWPDVPRAWLTVVVSNLATSGFRRSAVARRRTDDLNRDAAARVGALNAVVDAEFRVDARDEISNAINRLPADRRRAVLMAGAGYSATEIGREMGRTPAAVRTLLCRARQAMRSELIAILPG